MLTQGQVGPVPQTASAQAGTQLPYRQGNMGDSIVSELHGRYYEAAYRRAIFSAGNQAAVATTALGTLAHTGLVLSNPVGSLVNLVLLKVSYGTSVAVPTAGYVALQTGYNSGANVTHTTPATVYSNFIGVGAAGTGLVDVSATLPANAPVHRLFLSNTGTLATTGLLVNAPQVVDVEGSIILPPGAYVATYTFATNTAAWWFTFSWEEVPI